MSSSFVLVTCPSCFESFEIAVPAIEELPADLDYDCEICCRPMMIHIEGDADGVFAEARGIND